MSFITMTRDCISEAEGTHSTCYYSYITSGYQERSAFRFPFAKKEVSYGEGQYRYFCMSWEYLTLTNCIKRYMLASIAVKCFTDGNLRKGNQANITALYCAC